MHTNQPKCDSWKVKVERSADTQAADFRSRLRSRNAHRAFSSLALAAVRTQFVDAESAAVYNN